MLYQLDNTFKPYNFRAKYFLEDKEIERLVWEDKEEFERRLKEDLKRDTEHKAMQDWFENHPTEPYMPPQDTDVVLPQITYEEIFLSEAEKERLDRINQKHCGTLDDVKFYVKNGTYPDGDHSLKILEIEDLKIAGAGLGLQLFATQTNLTAVEQEKDAIASQIFDIQTQTLH